jgi:hypothetical protein
MHSKTKLWSIMAASVVVLIGCKSESERAVDQQPQTQTREQEPSPTPMAEDEPMVRDDPLARHDETPRMDTDRYERFEAIRDETKVAFTQRADEAISRIETDIQALESRAAGNKDAAEGIGDAKEAILEAREDLNEIRTGSDEVFDDGKMGVAVAINKAQREVEDIREEMKSPRSF